MERVEALTLTESDYPSWDGFVSTCGNGSIYSTARYLEILCTAAGGSFEIIAVKSGGEIVGGVALYERESLAGRYVQNRLLLYYNGVVFREETGSSCEAIVQAICEQVAFRRYSRLRLHCRTGGKLLPVPATWVRSSTKTYVVALESPEAVWKAFDKNCRRLIRRAEQDNVNVKADDDFESFFAMHEDIHRRKGAWIYLPKPAFARYISELLSSGLGALYHARLPSGEAVASQLVLLGEHPVTHTVAAGAKQEWMSRGVNPLLRWRVFEALMAAGYRGNDLTDAANESVGRFKKQLGSEIVENTVIALPDSPRYRAWHIASETREWLQSKARAAVRRFAGAFDRDEAHA